MGAESRKNVRKVITHLCIIFGSVFAIANTMMTQYLSEHYTDMVKPGRETWYRWEENDEYYVMADKVGFFSTGFQGAIQLKDIYYSSKHPELNITLEVSVDKLNRKKYKIVIENFDPGEEEFGGYAWVDKNMKYLPESRYDTETNRYMRNLLESNGPAVTRLVEIANERWNLGLTCGSGANEPS